MLDTMTFTKVLGGFCGALLIFLLGKWAAELTYHVGHDSHGGEELAVVYPIVDLDAEKETVEEEPFDFALAYETASASAGERQWSKCRACHQLEEERNGTGPHLVQVIGRVAGTVDGYGYSDALAAAGADAVWTPEKMNDWLINPSAIYPGTKMAYKLGDDEDRVNLIAYLESLGQ